MTDAAPDLSPGYDPDQRVTSLEQLEGLYGAPVPRSLTKEIDHVNADYRRFIEASPFVVLSSVGPEGTDCSPRGDPPGFVRVADPKTLMLPDRMGNNRTDTLRNIVRDPRVSLLFLVPGAGETIRVNGRASIVVDPVLCASFIMQGKPARSVLVVTVDRVYFQCQKALHRSKLWAPESRVARGALPTAGQILQNLDTGGFDGAAYDAEYPERMKQTMY
ncbi:MAG: pyridoxamine 5'-phosphate oxidase family protein [Alphaproteobacteria bacterium]|nr:pyridoxamine 5'-phosphate oxidase family protein [Alphaproteobacteria bacterium]